ncbi:MAG: Mfa1 fimbrilin C-terminal domain-containing protein [Muribaculaceae bacterium]|nr:Mfa1 fimbrilin C-terminal domain-containing protein [Muribaculaceae bacterium]
MIKKLLWLLPALALAACSDQSTINENPEPGNPPEARVTKYLSINVVSSLGTRADDYQNGTAEENTVNQVRFYFFDEEGEPFPVWENKGTGNNNFNSYLDWYPNATDGTTGSPGGSGSLVENETVEKILNVTLGLVMPANLQESQPASVLAVLNPPSGLLAYNPSTSEDTGASTLTVNGPSLETLRERVEDYRTGLMGAGTFVMSNSVYVDDNTIVDATIITEDNFGANEAEAEADPIIIYVERILARLDFVLGLTNTSQTLADGTVIYLLGQYNVVNGTNTTEGEEENIYVKLLGWNVTGCANSSRLVKMVDAGWTNTALFGNDMAVWNSVSYKRSFWGVNPNPQTDSFDYLYGDFNGSESTNNPFPAMDNVITTGTNSYTTYLQENANTYNTGTNGVINPEGPAYATDVIIAAQLVDVNGNPYPMCEWNYIKYTFPQLQAKLITTAFSNLYSRTGSDGAYTFKSIQDTDFTFATAYDLDMQEEDEANYYVYPVLSTSGAQLTWTMGNSQNAAVMTTAEVNTYMRDAVNHLMVWNNGMTYYFFPIQHLGSEDTPGYYGIVRNHIYLSTLKSLAGLGTPVYDSTETIYPERTQSDDNTVSAAIQILQWRVVAQDYNIPW